MRGSPLLRAILIVIALLALLIPLRTLTSRRSETATPLEQAVQGSTAKKRFRLELTSTTVPFKYQIAHDGETIWSGESNSTTVATDVELKFPPEGIDLVRLPACVLHLEQRLEASETPLGAASGSPPVVADFTGPCAVIARYRLEA